MTARPEFVDVWIFRVHEGNLNLLMLRRAPERLLGGLWQCVAGGIEAGETIVAAAHREVVEETGIGPAETAAFYSLDFVASFLWEPADAVMTSVHFALRVHPGTEPVLSHEHDAYEWLSPDEAQARAVWPAYREAMTRVRENLLDSERARWFEIAEGEGL